MAVIVPKTAAPGKPWVFRADAIERDAVVDQSLLAKGFHIVIAPLTAQSGAVREQWDATYKFLTDHGFSKKPVHGRDRDGGRRSLRLGHREPGQGRLHLRPESRAAQPHVENAAAR